MKKKMQTNQNNRDNAAKIVLAARSMVGKYPYSWGGGNDDGATCGIVQKIPPYCDDRNVVGFDCSGLVKYAVYQGTGISLIHHSKTQYEQAPCRVSLSEMEPGDLIFFGASPDKIHHVAVFSGNGMMIEAPGHNDDGSGIPVREVSIPQKEVISSAGRYW